MSGFWALWLASPMRLMVWLSSRAAAWAGVIVAWKKLPHGPNRTRRIIFWTLIINAAAWLMFVGGLWCLSLWRRGHPGS